jgi:hypothetical protein
VAVTDAGREARKDEPQFSGGRPQRVVGAGAAADDLGILEHGLFL